MNYEMFSRSFKIKIPNNHIKIDKHKIPNDPS